jgi:hypothetical protein
MIFRLWPRLALAAVLCVGALACAPEMAENPAYNRDGGPDFARFGMPCPKAPPDTDGDGISDQDEGGEELPPRDTDLDGIPDFRDLDSDNDGIPDSYEGRNGNACTPPADSDGDGVPDFRDLDSDDPNDATIPDRFEAGPNPIAPLDSDGDGLPDFIDPDDDDDGIPDFIEMTAQGAKKPTADPTTVPDTDGDGIPDYLDVDSDNDTILDKTEGFSDYDGDLIPNYRDTDSDGDCVSDAAEAGDDNLATAPVDTDGDGNPDYLDVDSDNDGLIDGQEDKNCNGVMDACETNRLSADSDGDGVSDLIEYEDCQSKPPLEQSTCACDGRDHTLTPLTRGDLVFVVPYGLAPSPDHSTASLSTDAGQVDVLFALDTTSTMQAPLGDLGMNIGQVVDKLKTKISNAAYGVFEFRDLGLPQNDPSGNPPNLPAFRYPWRMQTVSTTTGLDALIDAVHNLSALGGGDQAQAGWAALFTLASSATRTIDVFSSTTYSLVTNAGLLPLSPGEVGGTTGGAGFRAGSLPIVVTLSDAEWHDAPGSLVAADAESGRNPYPSTTGAPSFSDACNPCSNVPSRREAITALQNLGARVIGLAAVGSQTFGDPKTRAVKVALETGAVVNAGDFGDSNTRAPGCPIDKCCTGLDAMDNVVAEPTLAGQCPLAFTVDGNNGANTANAVAAAVAALTSSFRSDVHAEAQDVDPGTVSHFISQLVPNLSGMGPATLCVTNTPAPLEDKYIGPMASALGSDGVLDTFPGLNGGQLVCFDIVAKQNTAVAATDKPQVFRALIQLRGVSGSQTTNLGTPRPILFVVPPAIPNRPIN